jgi:hypothetical protein
LQTRSVKQLRQGIFDTEVAGEAFRQQPAGVFRICDDLEISL